MSRFLKKEILLLDNVELQVDSSNLAKLKGPKGENEFQLPSEVRLDVKEKKIKFSFSEKKNVKNTAKIGLAFRMIQNLIEGVINGFTKKLEINGVGYRWSISGKKLNMQLGFSHDIVFDIPEKINIIVDGNTLSVEGVDKSLVGQIADKIKSFRPVEPYKGKGICYSGEFVIKKAGKAGN